MGARLKKPEKLQGIHRSHLIKISQHPNVPAEKSTALPSRLAWLVLSKKSSLQTIAVEIKYGCIISEQGQFHVSLNAVEETEDFAEIVTTNEPNNTRAQQYYTSAVWKHKVDTVEPRIFGPRLSAFFYYSDLLLWFQFFMNVIDSYFVSSKLCDETPVRSEFVSLQSTKLNVLRTHTHHN